MPISLFRPLLPSRRADFVRKTGHIPCASLQEAWDLAQEKLAEQGKKDYNITIMGHASATLPILDK